MIQIDILNNLFLSRYLVRGEGYCVTNYQIIVGSISLSISYLKPTRHSIAFQYSCFILQVSTSMYISLTLKLLRWWSGVQTIGEKILFRPNRLSIWFSDDKGVKMGTQWKKYGGRSDVLCLRCALNFSLDRYLNYCHLRNI